MPHAHVVDGPRFGAFASSLPFELPASSSGRATRFLPPWPRRFGVLNHMLLGDVGTGKTVVAGALAAAADSEGQAMLLAPTEVLARQHMEGLGERLKAPGCASPCSRALRLPPSGPLSWKASPPGRVDVLIGTHALLSDDVVPRNLTLAVIDEQQRFGVDQRAEKLLEKGEAPDALYLTATPIPRTLALALTAISPCHHQARPHDSARGARRGSPASSRGDAFEAARKALDRGEQVFVVCPLVGKDARRVTRGGRPDADADAAGEEYHRPWPSRTMPTCPATT